MAAKKDILTHFCRLDNHPLWLVSIKSGVSERLEMCWCPSMTWSAPVQCGVTPPWAPLFKHTLTTALVTQSSGPFTSFMTSSSAFLILWVCECVSNEVLQRQPHPCVRAVVTHYTHVRAHTNTRAPLRLLATHTLKFVKWLWQEDTWPRHVIYPQIGQCFVYRPPFLCFRRGFTTLRNCLGGIKGNWHFSVLIGSRQRSLQLRVNEVFHPIHHLSPKAGILTWILDSDSDSDSDRWTGSSAWYTLQKFVA